MPTDRKIRIYDLFSGPHGPSPQSQNYGRHNKRIWQVAAVSIKQAVYLAAHDSWRKDKAGTGIVAYSNGDHLFTNDDGSTDYDRKYKHYQTVPVTEQFKPKKP